MNIHPTAVVSNEAKIAADAEIGPFCVIKGQVTIGSRCRLTGHVFIGSDYGIVEIGEDNYFGPCAVIGGPPQDITYKAQPTKLVIGKRNVFREFCTVNIATTKAEGITRVGDDNYLMTYTHIGHDCQLGNSIVIANDCHFGGHCVIEDFVKIGGVCSFNQFTRVGMYAFIAGASIVNKDILPYASAQGNYAVCRASNKIGLERAGFPTDVIEDVHKALRILLKGECTQAEALVRIEQECRPRREIQYLINFITSSKRGIAR